MNGKLIAIVAVSTAVIAAAISAAVATVKRAETARLQLEIADLNESAAREEAKKAAKEAEAKASEETIAKEKTKQAEAEKAKAKEAKERASFESRKAEAERVKAEREAEAKKAEREIVNGRKQIERDLLEAAKLTNRTAMAALSIAELTAKAEADKTDRIRLEHDREQAAVKAKELRLLDLDALYRRLQERERELRERERALQPDKTTAELEWAGGGVDSVLDENGNVVHVEKKPYLAENDRRLTKASRELARLERIGEEARSNRVESARSAVVGSLERLYDEADAQDRRVDADYYAKCILAMDPEWKPKKPQKEEDDGK